MNPRKTLAAGLAASLLLACWISPFASKLPDGLDKFAEDHGIAQKAGRAWKLAPMPDYTAPALFRKGSLATGLAGGIGTLLVFGILSFGGKLLPVRPPRPPQRAIDSSVGGGI